MRNMIFKTLFASILGSLVIAPLAHADRQGGGTLRFASSLISHGSHFDLAAVPQLKQNLVPTEWIRFEKVSGNRLSFQYLVAGGENAHIAEVVIERADIEHLPELSAALMASKEKKSWIGISPEFQDRQSQEVR